MALRKVFADAFANLLATKISATKFATKLTTKLVKQGLAKLLAKPAQRPSHPASEPASRAKPGSIRSRWASKRASKWASKWAGRLLGIVFGLLLMAGTHQAWVLGQSARQPVDAILVLGGSIRREIYAAQLARLNPSVPILISGGSDEPCVWLIFQRDRAPLENIWIEPCARSTLDNYRFSTPTLQSWGARHVKLITSGNHRTRALGLGRTILSGHGIWLSLELVPETGRPGNQESKLKTALELIRGFGWMVVSQVYQPHCQALHRLNEIDLATWNTQPYACEEQGRVILPPRLERLSDRLGDT